MIRGITSYYNRIPRFVLRFIHFVPIVLTAIYLILVATIVVPLAVATCFVVVPLLYVFWRAKQNRFNPVFLRIMYPFELIGTTIVNAPQIVSNVANSTKKIKAPSLSTVKMPKSKSGIIALKVLALLGVAGVAVYLVAVAAIVLPLAFGCCILLAPFCYLLWYIKEKKFIPLFHKIPAYLEHIGFNIVNSRKIMTNLMVGMKNIKWPMF